MRFIYVRQTAPFRGAPTGEVDTFLIVDTADTGVAPHVLAVAFNVDAATAIRDALNA